MGRVSAPRLREGRTVTQERLVPQALPTATGTPRGSPSHFQSPDPRRGVWGPVTQVRAPAIRGLTSTVSATFP